MESVLAEQPILTAGLIGLVVVILLYGWLQTGKTPVLIGAGLAALLVPAAFALASYWTSDRELIEAAIERTALAVQENDIDRALQVFEPTQRAKIDTARADLSRFRFEEARINKIRTVDVLAQAVPPTAEVDMSVKVVVSDVRGQIRNFQVLRRVILQFRKAPDGQWFVYDYNHLPIVGEPDAFSPRP